jgi:hypothetical protein
LTPDTRAPQQGVRKLLVVRVADCDRPGLLSGMVSIDPGATSRSITIRAVSAAVLDRRMTNHPTSKLVIFAARDHAPLNKSRVTNRVTIGVASNGYQRTMADDAAQVS